ncbi:MAG: radical SAM protein, partial [Bacteroidales bacterium]|nr:radical SAM protein [Bacteroidales bacterium]
ANPDDLSQSFLRQVKDYTQVNRLSIGIQSFYDDDLAFLNRRHRASQSVICLEHALKAGFRNINIDLIYGIPGMTLEKWEANLKFVPYDKISHLSAYHLTIEPGTRLYKMMKSGVIKLVDEENSCMQYMLLCRETKNKNFQHYEISNFSRDGFHSIHNSGYWKQKKYLGLGPSAHSYNMKSRQWNVSDVKIYIDALQRGRPEVKIEKTNNTMRFNEYVMVSLRTIWGANLDLIRSLFGEVITDHFIKNASIFLNAGQMNCKDDIYTITENSWFISDNIISRMMLFPQNKK